MDVTNAMILEAGEKDPEYAERMLLIQLFLAERAWSHCMQLKQEIPEHPRKRFHMIKRLRKAAEYADKFEKLCHEEGSPCTTLTKEESEAYAGYIKGLYKMERQSWAEAKEDLTKSLEIYLKMCISISKEDTLGNYRQRIDELRANLKYCAFNLGEKDNKTSKSKVVLPSVLKFHDVAYLHAIELLEEGPQVSPETPSKKVVPVESTKGDETKGVSEEDEDEFQETRQDNDDDKVGAEDEEDDEDEEEDSDDNEEQAPSRVGGVTGLVKNWLGGAWS